MGRREWGVHLRSNDDIKALKKLVSDHNQAPFKERGEDLRFYSIIRFEDEIYGCIGNGGGGIDTSTYIENHWKETEVLHPFDKPDGWYDCEDYLWKGKWKVIEQPSGRLDTFPEEAPDTLNCFN